VGFAADGKLLALRNSWDGHIHLWDVEAAADVRTYPGHKQGDEGWWTVFSPDRKTFAGMSDDYTIHFWNVSSGKPLGILPPHPHLADDRGVWFTPNGKAAATIKNCSIRLWDVRTGKELLSWSAHHDVTALAFAPDGKTFVTTRSDGPLLLWDAVAGASQLAKCTGPELSASWDALASPDPIQGHRAVCTLVGAAPQTVPFLRQRFARRPAPPEAGRLALLIAELDDARFEVREEASRQLFELGESSERALRKALDGDPSLEMRYRLEDLLEKVERLELSAEASRWQRAIEVLEYVGNAEAKDLLELLVKELPRRQAQEAREALQRLTRRTSPGP
jgi:hypothetical protein